MDAKPRRRPYIPWIAGIVAFVSTILLVLAFLPLKACPNRQNLEEREQEPGHTGAHLPACPPCGGRGNIPMFQWLMICKVCGGSGVERGWKGFIATPDTKCQWCNGTGKLQFKLR
jgi:hypothetical protein